MIKKSLKTVSTLLSAIFIFTSIAQAAPLAYTFETDPSQGTVTQRYRGEDERTVIILQDAHTDLSAQLNISELLKSTVDADSMIIGVEGSIGKYDFNELRAYPHKDALKTLGRDYVKNGVFTGAELAAITNDRDVTLYGIEDKDLFLSNYEAFFNVRSNVEDINTFIKNADENIKRLADSILNPELKEFFLYYNQTINGEVAVIDHLNKLYSMIGKLDIDTLPFMAFSQFVEAQAEMAAAPQVLVPHSGTGSSTDALLRAGASRDASLPAGASHALHDGDGNGYKAKGKRQKVKGNGEDALSFRLSGAHGEISTLSEKDEKRDLSTSLEMTGDDGAAVEWVVLNADGSVDALASLAQARKAGVDVSAYPALVKRAKAERRMRMVDVSELMNDIRALSKMICFELVRQDREKEFLVLFDEYLTLKKYISLTATSDVTVSRGLVPQSGTGSSTDASLRAGSSRDASLPAGASHALHDGDGNGDKAKGKRQKVKGNGEGRRAKDKGLKADPSASPLDDGRLVLGDEVEVHHSELVSPERSRRVSGSNGISNLVWNVKQGFLRLGGEIEVDSEKLVEIARSAEVFYDVALSRDEALVNNLLAEMDRAGKKTGVLVAGGFHADGITRILREKGVSFVNVIPHLDGLGRKALAEARMLGSVVPVNAFFGGNIHASRFAATLQGMKMAGVITSDQMTAIESDFQKKGKGYTALKLSKVQIEDLFKRHADGDTKLKNALKEISDELKSTGEMLSNLALIEKAGKLVEDAEVFEGYLKRIQESYELAELEKQETPEYYGAPESENANMEQPLSEYEQKLFDGLLERVMGGDFSDEVKTEKSVRFLLGIEENIPLTAGQKKAIDWVAKIFIDNGILLMTDEQKGLKKAQYYIYRCIEKFVDEETAGQRSLYEWGLNAEYILFQKVYRLKQDGTYVQPNRFDNGHPPKAADNDVKLKGLDKIKKTVFCVKNDKKLLGKVFDEKMVDRFKRIGMKDDQIKDIRNQLVNIVNEQMEVDVVDDEAYLLHGQIIGHARKGNPEKGTNPGVWLGSRFIEELVNYKKDKEKLAWVFMEKMMHVIAEPTAYHAEMTSLGDYGKVIEHSDDFYNMMKSVATSAELRKHDVPAGLWLAYIVLSRDEMKGAPKYETIYEKLYDDARKAAAKEQPKDDDLEYQPERIFYRELVALTEKEKGTRAEKVLYEEYKKKIRELLNRVMKYEEKLHSVEEAKEGLLFGTKEKDKADAVADQLPDWFEPKINGLVKDMLSSINRITSGKSSVNETASGIVIYLKGIFHGKARRHTSKGEVKRLNPLDKDVDETGKQDQAKFIWEARDREKLKVVFDKWMWKRFKRMEWSDSRIEEQRDIFIDYICNKEDGADIDVIDDAVFVGGDNELLHARSGLTSKRTKPGVWIGEKRLKEIMRPSAFTQKYLDEYGMTNDELFMLSLLEESQHFYLRAVPHDKYQKTKNGDTFRKVVEHEKKFSQMGSIVAGVADGFFKTDHDIVVWRKSLNENSDVGLTLAKTAKIVYYASNGKDMFIKAEEKQAARSKLAKLQKEAIEVLGEAKWSNTQPVLVVSDKVNNIEFKRIKDLQVCKAKRVLVFREKDYYPEDKDTIMYIGEDEKDLPEMLKPHANLFVGKDELSDERMSAMLNIELFVYELIKTAQRARQNQERELVVRIADLLPNLQNVAWEVMEGLREALREVYGRRRIEQSA